MPHAQTYFQAVWDRLAAGLVLVVLCAMLTAATVTAALAASGPSPAATPVPAAAVTAPLTPPAPVPAAASSVAPAPVTPPAPVPKPEMTMSSFLDRLMAAESGGRDDASNPRSTAVGPYQFIESTWLDLARRIFATETQAMTPQQILALRTNRAFARRAAEAYSLDNAAALKTHGLAATFPHLRLAFLLGPSGAVRVLQAPPQTRVTFLLGPAVANANPFMYGLTAEGLIARAARDLDVKPSTLAGIVAGDIPPGPASKSRRASVAVRCNLALPACRRWRTLAQARVWPVRVASRRVPTAKGR